MSDLATILGAAGSVGVVGVGAIAAVWRHLTGQIREKDERIAELFTLVLTYKGDRKADTRLVRSLRHEVELLQNGLPSVAPASGDDEPEELSGVYEDMRIADRSWAEKQLKSRRDGIDRQLERYNRGETISTPPEPVPPKRAPQRSRPR